MSLRVRKRVVVRVLLALVAATSLVFMVYAGVATHTGAVDDADSSEFSVFARVAAAARRKMGGSVGGGSSSVGGGSGKIKGAERPAVRLIFPLGEFRWEAPNVWRELDSEAVLKHTFLELSRNTTHVTVKDNDRDFLLLLPLRSGLVYFSSARPVVWNRFEFVVSGYDLIECPYKNGVPNPLWKQQQEDLPRTPFHIIYNTESKAHLDWQSRFSHYFAERTQHKGSSYTRLLSHRGAYAIEPIAKTVPTFFSAPAPQTIESGYTPYNKPFSIMQWLRSYEPSEDVVVILDPDCFLVADLSFLASTVTEGRPLAQEGYMGPMRFPPKNDEERASAGATLTERYCNGCEWADPIAVPIFIHKNDLKKLAPKWLEKTEFMRADKANWTPLWVKGHFNLDWTVEMYGYIFAAAEMGMKHTIRKDLQAVSGFDKQLTAPVIHYHLPVKFGDGSTWFKHTIGANETKNIPFPVPPKTTAVDACVIEMLHVAATNCP